MFTFNRKKKEEFDYVAKLIDNQGEILKIVEEQREMIKRLQETIKRLQNNTSNEKES